MMTPKILIIEDEPDIRAYLIAVLEDHGFSPFNLRAGNRSSLADAVTSAAPDLIILDLMMPQRSGISIYSELRSHDELKSIPIVIMSGYTPEDVDMGTGFQQMIPGTGIEPPDAFIDKPIDLKAFVSLVKRLTRKE